MKINQLISTQQVIEWFRTAENKQDKKFLQLDIGNCYPSISEQLLSKALSWAKTYTYISDKAFDVIFCSRRNVLFDGKDIWVKKQNSKFDIAMGAYDGAECSEIVGLYLLNKIIFVDKIFSPDECCLYRDDMLSLLKASGPVMERKKKQLIRLFKDEGLNVTCQTNLERAQFLDVLFDLKTGTFKPFHKPNSKIQYVSTGSNHPRIVLNNIPIGVNQRLSTISSDENAFNSEKSIFQEALHKAGYKHELSFRNNIRKKIIGHQEHNRQNQHNNNMRSRKNIIWFNPPFNIFCSTNVGREFRHLIEKHFKRGTDLGKLFNRHKLKISYSCLPNLKTKIAAHNRKILFGQINSNGKGGGCNCHQPQECPMEGACMVSDIIYEAEVLKPGEVRGEGHFYVGLASGPFKKRWYNHTNSFRDETKSKFSELAKFVWSLKNKNIQPKISFKTLSFEKPYSTESGRCQLCTKEKLEIVKNISKYGAKALNRRQELFRNCIHKNKHLLGSINTRHKGQIFMPRYNNIDNIEIPSGSTRSGKNWRKEPD